MNLFKPEAIYDGVAKIDFKYLQDMGIKGVLLDVDNTLIDMKKVMPEGITEWVQKAKDIGLKVMILTNTNKKLSKVEPIAKALDIQYISFAKKPAKSRLLQSNETFRFAS